MPVVFTSPQFPNQSGASPYSQSFSTQLNAGQMLREVTSWNPNVDPQVALRMINNAYRKVVDRRSWYGLKVRGNISVPQIVNGGTCTATNGSATVQGIGTTWTPAIVGQQFRQSFTQPYQSIVAINPVAQTLILDTLFPGVTATGGYQIIQVWVTMGGNIKRLSLAINQQQGWEMNCQTPQETLAVWDPWRQSLGWSTDFSPMPPTPDGQFQVECWPSPYSAQVFPFQAYTQPPDMQADTDCPVAWIQSDLLVTKAIADALMFRPKQNQYYDIQSAIAIAGEKKKEFEARLSEMEMADNDMDQRDTSWDYGLESGVVGYGPNSAWGQTHDV